MKLSIASLLGLGILLVGRALFAPLLRIPVIGALRFSESSLGGLASAWGVIAGLGLATVLMYIRSGRWLGALLGGASLGFLAASLLAIYRSAMDRLQILMESGGDSGIQQLLSGMEVQSGCWVLAAGALLWLAGAFLACRRPVSAPGYRID